MAASRHPDYRVTHRRARFGDYLRLFFAVRRQPQFQQYTGALTWAIYLATLPLAYALAWLRGLPEVVLVSENGRLMSGIMITRSGRFTNFVSFGDAYGKPRAAILGYAELQRMLESPPYRDRALYLRTADYNRSLVRSLRRLGFVVTDRPSYMITALLGPLRFSWASGEPRKSRLFHVEHQVLLERGPK